MRAIVINLASASERMAFQTRQLETLGIAYERFEAVNASNAASQRPDAYWNTWERPLRDSEKACFLSHWLIWKKISEAATPMLVLEDDAVLSDKTPALLGQLADAVGLDLLSLEVRGRKKLVEKEMSRQTPPLAIRRMYQDRNGAAAYILWPSGARKLLTRTERRSGIADAVISSSYELNAFQADPALAVQIDICRHYGIEEPISTSSSISMPTPRSSSETASRLPPIFKIRRIASQLRMGLRQALKSSVAVRRQIELDTRGFDYLKALKIQE